VTAVTFDPRSTGITTEFILDLAAEFLPQNCTAPYYSIQLSLEYNPERQEPTDPAMAAAFAALKSDSKKWKVEPHLIMEYDLESQPAPQETRTDVEVVEIPHGQESEHYLQFEIFEKISADAFEYDYMPEITAAHLSMGDTNSLAATPVTYQRLLFRRRDDGVFVGMGSFMVARGFDIAYISEIAVHPDCQKRGYGQFIINTIVERIAALGQQRAVLASTPQGIALYLKVGFHTVPDCVTMMVTSRKPKDDSPA
jgi:GNAT superfamily N-acetyltransferase